MKRADAQFNYRAEDRNLLSNDHTVVKQQTTKGISKNPFESFHTAHEIHQFYEKQSRLCEFIGTDSGTCVELKA